MVKFLPAKARDPEPRWPAVVALLAIGGMHLALPESMTYGPDWLLLVVVAVMLIPVILARRYGRHSVNQWLGYGAVGLVTLDMAWSVFRLISALPSHTESPVQLLRSAVILWVSNILIFASWYWRLDAGGPNERDTREHHTDGAFLFPQMTLQPAQMTEAQQRWRPGFVDYLFLAFNTSTAFSPTDVPVLSRWAKLLMMVQATIALAVVIVLAARAINIL
jgi:hypothetical protein